MPLIIYTSARHRRVLFARMIISPDNIRERRKKNQGKSSILLKRHYARETNEFEKNRIRVNNIESITIFHCAHAKGAIKNVHKIRNICGIKMKIFSREDWCDFKVADRQCEACLQRGKIKCGEQDILYYADNLLEKLRFRWKMCVFFFSEAVSFREFSRFGWNNTGVDIISIIDFAFSA